MCEPAGVLLPSAGSGHPPSFSLLRHQGREVQLSSVHLSLLQVVQEYERAVIFRLGLLLSGGARGPGVFFVIPCVDHYQKIDMRTQTYDVPPQEVKTFLLNPRTKEVMSASFYRF